MPAGRDITGRRIAYGAHACEVILPRSELAVWALPACPLAAASPAEIISKALDNPIASERLHVMARGKRSAAILIPGKDRIAATAVFLPQILGELNQAGIPDDGISITVATGTHVKHSQDDMKRLLGEEAAARVRFRQHKPQAGDHLTRVGVTSCGTPVELDKSVVEAGIKVLTGRIIPHYFAGFSGGRKAMVPGVASFRTILANHRLTLDPERGIHRAVAPCSLGENPVHLDMVEAAKFTGPSFVLNTLLDAEHRLVDAVAGDLEAAHSAGCSKAEKWFKVSLGGPVDAVITSAGGAPYDCDFVQSLKAIFDVQDVVKPGGAILWVAECAGGMKEAFSRWAEYADDKEQESAIRMDYNLAGHNSMMLRRLIRRVRVALWSALPAASVRALGLEPVASLQEGLDWVASVSPRDFRCAVVPHGNITYVTK